MKFSFAILCKSSAFRVTILVFGALNLLSWVRHKLFPICCDQEIAIGYPFPFHISGGIAGASDFYILGLLLDIATALTVAVSITWLVKLIRD